MIPVKWTDEAVADRLSILEFISTDNAAAAADNDLKFLRAVERMSRFPAIGRVGRVPGTREFVVTPSYILIYDVQPRLIRIIRVLNTRRQWPPEA